MIIYVEACHAGSMFDAVLDDNLDSKKSLNSNMNSLLSILISRMYITSFFFTVFVMTASDPNESSYACYFDDYRDAYLGDVFSVIWMHEAETVRVQSVHQLYVIRV